MTTNDLELFSQNGNLGISYSDYLFAYRKEVNRILKLSNNNLETACRHALNKLVEETIITQVQAKTLEGCIKETIKVRQGKADIQKTLIYLQNNSAKGLIESKANYFNLSIINLCIGLVREVDDYAHAKSGQSEITLKQIIATFPGGSGAAIVAGALAGGFIGGSIGGLPGAILGGLIGGLIGTSNDVDVVVPDPQGGGGTPT